MCLPYPPFRRLPRRGQLYPLMDIGAGLSVKGAPNAGIAYGLPRELTINGQTKTPTFLYKAADLPSASSNWAGEYGETLTAAGSGGTAGLAVPTPEEADRAVNTNASRYWGEAGTSFGNLGTDDAVFEFIFQFKAPVSLDYIAAKRAASGWYCITSGSTVILYVSDGTDFVNTISGALPEGWHHIMVFLDRSGSSQMYVNGAASGSPRVLTDVDDVSTTAKFRVAASSTGGSPYPDKLAYLAMWQGANWLDTHLQAAVAAERFAQLWGVYSDRYGGPSQALLRNSVATVARRTYGGVTRFFTVGPYVPRLENPRDAETDRGDDRTVANGFHYSEDFTQADWTKVACSIETATGVYDHTGKIQMQGIIGTAADTVHAISSPLTPSSNFRHINHYEVAAGNLSAVRISSTNLSSVSVWTQFDLTGNGRVGLKSSAVDILEAGIELVAAGRWHIWICYDGGTANHVHLVVPIEDADVDDTTYLGDGATSDLYVTAANHDYSDPDTGRTAPVEYVRTVGQGRTLGKAGAGYRSEGQHTNQALQSNDFTQVAQWTLNNEVTYDTTGTESPDGGTAYGVRPSAVFTSAHRVGQNIANAAVTQCFIGVFKHVAGRSREWVRCDLGACNLYFNVKDGTIGTATSITESDKYDLGDGWWLLWFTCSPGALANAYVYCAASNGSVTFTGDAQTDFYLWHMQVTATAYPVSLIKTTTAAATRLADRLSYQGLAIDAKGTMAVDVLNLSSDASIPLMGMSDNGDVNQRVSAYLTTNKVAAFVAATTLQAAVTGATAVGTRIWREARVTYKQDEVNVYRDGAVDATPDTSCNIPQGMDTIELGANRAGAVVGSNLVRCRLFSRVITDQVTAFDGV